MPKPNKPTIIYPNGKEDIIGRSIRIEWVEPEASSTLSNIWYEIFFTELYDPNDEPDWVKIAVVPQGYSFFDWKMGNKFKSQNCKFAIRSMNERGERSDLSISADYVSIKRDLPPSPVVLSPLPNSFNGSSVEISFDDSAIIDTYAQRAKYYIYIKSDKANIPYTSIAQSLPVGVGSITWDTGLLPPSDDYAMTIYLADDDGNKSREVIIDNLTISADGFFITDTKPPSGFIEIDGSHSFTRERDVSVKVYGFDEATGIHSMRFLDFDENAEYDVDYYSEMKYISLPDEDGVKTIQVVFQDFGGNRTSEIKKSFRVLYDAGDTEIADAILYKNTVWLGVNGPNIELIKLEGDLPSVQGRLNEPINAIAYLNDVIYISVHTSTGTARIYKNSSTGLSVAIEVEEEDSEILSMTSFRENLYLGSEGGQIYRYDGSLLTEIYSLNSPIQKMYADNALLYILPRNSDKIYVYDTNTVREVDVK